MELDLYEEWKLCSFMLDCVTHSLCIDSLRNSSKEFHYENILPLLIVFLETEAPQRRLKSSL